MASVARQGRAPGVPDPLRDDRAGLRAGGPHERLGVDAWHDHAQLDAVQERPTDASHVACRLPHRATARSGRVTVPAAAAGVHGRDELQPRRVADGAVRAHDLHRAVLQRLAHRVQYVAVELRELVEEEDAVVSLRHETGTRAAVRRPPWPRRRWCDVARGRVATAAPNLGLFEAGHTADDRDLTCLVLGEPRQQARRGSSQQRLAGAGRADEQQVVTSCQRHLQRPARVFLTADVREVGEAGLDAGGGLRGGIGGRADCPIAGHRDGVTAARPAAARPRGPATSRATSSSPATPTTSMPLTSVASRWLRTGTQTLR